MPDTQLNPTSWIENYGDMLLNYALVRVPERDIAKDLVQDTFVTALRTKEQYRGELSEKNWLFLILRSRILDYFKKKKELLAPSFSNDEEVEYDPFDENGFWIKDSRPQEWSTDEAINQSEFQTVLKKCMDNLNKQHKDVFAMKYIEGLETEDVCKELSISSSNYWVLVHRAKLKLRKCLEVNWIN